MSRKVIVAMPACVVLAALLAASAPGQVSGDNPLGELLGGPDTSKEPALEFRVVASHTTVEPGGTVLVAVATTIPEGYHLQDEVRLALEDENVFTLGRWWHSRLHARRVGGVEFKEFVGEFLAVYELRAGPGAAEGPRTLALTFEYAPCNDELCFGLREIERALAVAVGMPAVENAEFGVFRDTMPSLVAGERGGGQPVGPRAAPGTSNAVYVARYDLVGKPNIIFFNAAGEELTRIVGYRGEKAFYREVRDVAGGRIETPKERSLPLWLGLALVGGLLAAFSPCVYPMIPITMGYLADQAGPKFGRNVAMTSALGVGVVLPFGLIGAFIGALKDVLYGLTSNVVYILILDVVLVVLAASMLGAFEIQLPAALRNKAASGRNAVGLIGAFVIGLVVVPLAFACTAPALGLIIPFVLGKGVGVAVAIMVVFGLGLALPFLAVGTFAGALSAMPRAGAWMLGIKKVFAVVLVAVIFYVSRPLTQTFPHATGMLAGGVFVALAVALGVFRRRVHSVFNRAVAIVAVAVGLTIAVGTVVVESGKAKWFPLQGLVRYPEVGEAAFSWRHDLDAAFDEAKRENKLVMAYFWGYNCLACTEYAVRVWNRPEAARALRDFVPVKINVDE